ncbi:hypothetical protein NQ176_g205 [Zarea fungicola]|uniref:Uncharacterized protein n=1 Tax=Zarea fungicola TaxID=93591 RepID=A0ACC1NXN5_9HYPO|nr:hypothetical protein NQ176_g205 [Lecanicillium fungicola]
MIDIQEDLDLIRSRLADELKIAGRYGTGPWAMFKGVIAELARKGMRNRLLLIVCAFSLQNMSGAAAINYYSPTLFASLGIKDVALYTGIYGLVKAVASVIFYGLLIDLWGRRNPTIISSFMCSVCLWIVGSYVKIGHPASVIAAGKQLSPSTAAGGTAATAMIMIYSVFWSFGLNGIPWIVSAEIFPGSVRNFTGTFAALMQWLTQFIITKALPYIFNSFGYGTWYFFATWMLIATAWSFFFLPETKGKTLEDMDNIFGYKSQWSTESIESAREDEASGNVDKV